MFESLSANHSSGLQTEAMWCPVVCHRVECGKCPKVCPSSMQPLTLYTGFENNSLLTRFIPKLLTESHGLHHWHVIKPGLKSCVKKNRWTLTWDLSDHNLLSRLDNLA